MFGRELNVLVNAQMDLSAASQAALQAWTLIAVGYDPEVYIRQMNACLEQAACSLGKKIVDAKPIGEA
jgi:hypothetical protein